MSGYTFFKPTLIYKEFILLDLIDKNKNITQREMGKSIGVSVSMVNSYLDDYEKNELIVRKKHTSKSVEYFITKKGVERMRLLNIGYLKNSQMLYVSARENIEKFLIHLESKEKKKIFLYGAGEVAEILLHTIYSSKKSNLTILGVIDDDPKKIGNIIYNTQIVSLDAVKIHAHDGILVSSYTNRHNIIKRLSDYRYDLNKIFNFFD